MDKKKYETLDDVCAVPFARLTVEQQGIWAGTRCYACEAPATHLVCGRSADVDTPPTWGTPEQWEFIQTCRAQFGSNLEYPACDLHMDMTVQ